MKLRAENSRIYLSPPDVGQLEESYLVRALRSGWVAPLGPEVDAFECEVAERVGVAHALAVSSGTAALHLALLALGAGPGQVVVVPTLTFVATANAVVYTGAEPVFVDCDPATGNIDPALLADLLHRLRTAGQRIAAVVPVDMFGACADYAEIVPICAAARVPLLVDAAESLGATYRGQQAGSFGRIAALSFNGNKIITTSGGGMLVSDDAGLIARSRYLATQARQPVPHYEHLDVGYNYRLSNLLAALGRAQLSRLDEMLARRRELRERYAKLFAAVPGVRLLGDVDPAGAGAGPGIGGAGGDALTAGVRVAPDTAGARGSNCWLTTIVVDPERAGWRAEQLGAHLAEQDIETRPVWKPMHLQPIFTEARAVLTGAAQRLFDDGLTLPSGSALDETQTARVFHAIEQFLADR